MNNETVNPIPAVAANPKRDRKFRSDGEEVKGSFMPIHVMRVMPNILPNINPRPIPHVTGLETASASNPSPMFTPALARAKIGMIIKLEIGCSAI